MSVHDIRPFQTATKFRDKPNTYRALVRAIAHEQAQGRNGHAPLHNARLSTRAPNPENAA
jgi:hypothetical protein